MLWLVRAGSRDADEALRSAPATADDLADVAVLGPKQGAARLVRRRLLRAYAAATLKTDPAIVVLERSDRGGLYVAAPTRLFASVAGRGEWTALALSSIPIGVDVETIPPDQPLPLNLLHSREQRALEMLAGSARDIAFLKFWTARESYVKAGGRGLPAELFRIEAQEAKDGQSVILMEDGAVAATAHITMQMDAIAAVVELPAPK